MPQSVDEVFSEILNKFKELSTRISKFETWEPAEATGDVGAHAYRSSGQVLTGAIDNTVAFDAELWDTDSIHSGGTFTIPSAGKYLLNTAIETSGEAGNFILKIKHGSNIPKIKHNMFWEDGHFSAIFDCSASDTIIVQVLPSVGTTLSGGSWVTIAQIQKIG